jgi:hypothetical protein
MEDALAEVCKDIRIGKILIQVSQTTGPNVMKHFTAVIYERS